MDKTYIIIAAVFAANLLISLILRVTVNFSKSRKKLNNQLKSHDLKLNAEIHRLEESYKKCEQDISAKVEDAKDIIAKVAETLDIIFVHQRELSQLEDVCKNYKIALEKLKIQTEQAEARIHAVQAEVRKAESVDSFVQQFHMDAERLTNQMLDLKAEYVRLVASTEQNLKVASQNQLDENNQMLTAFGVSLERFKSQFAEFISVEKTGFEDLCKQQELVACNNLNVLSEKSLEIHESIDKATDGLSKFRTELENSTAELEERKEAIIASVADVSDRYQSDMKAFGESMEEALRTRLKVKEDEISSTIESFGEKMDQEAASIGESVSMLEERREAVIASIEEAEGKYAAELKVFCDNSSEALSDKLKAKESELETFLAAFATQMANKESEIVDLISVIDTKKDQSIEDFSSMIQDEAEKVEEAINRLRDSKDASVKEYIDKMQDEEAKAEESIKNMESRKISTIQDFDQSIEAKKKDFEASIAALESERESYVAKCRAALEQSFEDVISESDAHMDKLKNAGDEMMKHLSERVNDSREAVILLNETSREKINESIDTLAGVEKRIADSKDKLNSLGEEITAKKKSVWELNQEILEKEGILESIQGDVSIAQDKAYQAKANRVQEEAAMLRLKAQRGSSSKPQKGDENHQAKKSERRPQDMIEAFPEDIFIGDEERVSLDD